jgi:competence protein ComEC
VGSFAGTLTWGLIWLMNKTILRFNRLPISVWDGISISVLATIILYAFVVCVGYWLLNKSKIGFIISLFALLTFTVLSGYTKWKTSNQQKLIVYNVPQHQSIDFISGNNYKFIGDSSLLVDGILQNFHLKPGRIGLQINRKVDLIPSLHENNSFYQFNNTKVILIDQPIVFEPVNQKITVDYIIISKNPKLYLPDLAKVFNCNKFIFDGSNSLWRITKWKKDCEELHLHCYSVPEKGAFVLDL